MMKTKPSISIFSFSFAAPKEKSRKFEIFDQVIMSFSVYTNTIKLLSTNESKDSIGCIHGMRFFSMTWVILVHTYNLGGLAKGELIAWRPFLCLSSPASVPERT